jgi:hypothetical protein
MTKYALLIASLLIISPAPATADYFGGGHGGRAGPELVAVPTGTWRPINVPPTKPVIQSKKKRTKVIHAR